MAIGNVVRDFFGVGQAAARDAAGAARGPLQPGNLSVDLTRNSLGAVENLIDSAGTSLRGDMFVLRDPQIEQALVRADARGVKQHFLLDPELGSRDAFPAGADLVEFGQVPFKNHSKMWAADGGERALLTTGAYVPYTRRRIEGVATFDGPAAQAVRDYLKHSIQASAATDGSRERATSLAAVRAAAEEMGRYGVVANDQMAGVRSLTEGVQAIVRNEQRGGQLTISTKIYNDPGFRTLVDDAVARGVNVRFSDIRDNDMHATVVAGTERFYLGTAHLSPRGLGDMRYAYRKARDSGIIVSDAAQTAQLRARMDELGMTAMTPEEFDKTRRFHDDMDGFYKLEERAQDKPGAVSPDALAVARAKYDTAVDGWRNLKDEVAASRAADGITFANPDGHAVAP